MPRSARIVLPGTALHIVHRANNRARCFFTDEDKAFYLFHLGRALPRSRCLLHAYCLMDNHVHLLVTPGNAESCALLMKAAAQLYAHYFNKAYRRTGYLWEGRFKSCLVQAQHYVLACYRYIEMNPVRASITPSAADFPWSSFRANACGQPSPLITPHAEYDELGKTASERQAVYRELFGQSLAASSLDEIRRATNGGFVLGDRSFKNAMAKILRRRVEAGRPGRRPQANGADTQADLLRQEIGVRP